MKIDVSRNNKMNFLAMVLPDNFSKKHCEPVYLRTNRTFGNEFVVIKEESRAVRVNI